MNTSGLELILVKEEIIQTQHAVDLLNRAEIVDSTYTRHVRGYVPLGQQAHEERSVLNFARQVIRGIKDAGAVRGYITAEYGYGKTSTALYLWQQAKQANLLAVPPFRMTQLSDLITATYGWLRYELQRTRPGSPLITEAESLYNSLIERNATTLAKEYNIDKAAAYRLITDKSQILELNEADYIRFFEEATRLAKAGGFEGVLILADELQQYLDPSIKTGVRDPISPLFDVISGLLTRKGYLHLGILFVIPPHDLDILRDQRGDLVQRALQASLDLRSIYDRDFPKRLWFRLAEELDFLPHRDRVVAPETLESLGQICMRVSVNAHDNLADGPRTIINTFKTMTERYLDLGCPHDDAYTPYHLIDDFITERISFNSSKRIQRVVNQALGHSLVKGRLNYEHAIKWAAAFPDEGITRKQQENLGLLQAFDDLMQSTQGDLLISVGDVKQSGITLRGLDRVNIKTDVLSQLLREFGRLYDENTDTSQRRAIRGIFDLLKTKIFPNPSWKVTETRSDSTLTHNRGLTLEGHFASYSRKYPERRVHLQLLWEDELIKGTPEGDFSIQIRLRTHLNIVESTRRQLAEPVEIDKANRLVKLTLNLMYLDEASLSPTLDQTTRDIISPYKLTAMLLLALHEFIQEKRGKNLIPKSDDAMIASQFQPELLDNAMRLLFNEKIGQLLKAAQERLLEVATQQLLEQLYPEYITLMQVANWSSSLGKYRNAIKHLEAMPEKQGQIAVEGSKEEIADLFTVQNTGLDSLMNNFSQLIKLEGDFHKGKKGSVRFTLHDLESKIKHWLELSTKSQKVMIKQQSHEVRTLTKDWVYERAERLGYREKEITEIITLMQERGLIVVDKERGLIRQEVNLALDFDEIQREVESWQKDINLLLTVFGDKSQLRDWEKVATQIFTLVANRPGLDNNRAFELRRGVRLSRERLSQFMLDCHQELAKDMTHLQQSVPRLKPCKELSNQIKGAVEYVGQVDDLRNRLKQKHTTLNHDLERYQKEIETFLNQLKSGQPTPERLVTLRQNYQKLQQSVTPWRQKTEEFDQELTQFNQWGRLIEQGSILANDISELGEVIAPQRILFQQLSSDVKGHLSAYKEKALSESAMFESRLREIAETVRTAKTQAIDTFTKLQENYQHTLSQQLKFPRNELWSPYRYNLADPKDIYRRLYDEVQQFLQQRYLKLSEELAKMEGNIYSIRQNPDLKNSDKRMEVETTSQKLLTELQQQQQNLAELKPQIDDLAYIRDETQKFQTLIAHLSAVISKFPDMKHGVKTLQELISQWVNLTPEEEQLLELLPAQGSADLSLMRQNSPLSADEFWAILRQLHGKQRLRVLIERVRME